MGWRLEGMVRPLAVPSLSYFYPFYPHFFLPLPHATQVGSKRVYISNRQTHFDVKRTHLTRILLVGHEFLFKMTAGGRVYYAKINDRVFPHSSLCVLVQGLGVLVEVREEKHSPKSVDETLISEITSLSIMATCQYFKMGITDIS